MKKNNFYSLSYWIGLLAIFIIGFGLYYSYFSQKEDVPKRTTVVGASNTLKVPTSTLHSASLTRELKKMGLGLIWVWMEKEKKVVPVVVKIGITDGAYTEVIEVISGDLKEGDLVIVGYQPTNKQTRQAQRSVSRVLGVLR